LGTLKKTYLAAGTKSRARDPAEAPRRAGALV